MSAAIWGLSASAISRSPENSSISSAEMPLAPTAAESSFCRSYFSSSPAISRLRSMTMTAPRRELQSFSGSIVISMRWAGTPALPDPVFWVLPIPIRVSSAELFPAKYMHPPPAIGRRIPFIRAPMAAVPPAVSAGTANAATVRTMPIPSRIWDRFLPPDLLPAAFPLPPSRCQTRGSPMVSRRGTLLRSTWTIPAAASRMRTLVQSSLYCRSRRSVSFSSIFCASAGVDAVRSPFITLSRSFSR